MPVLLPVERQRHAGAPALVPHPRREREELRADAPEPGQHRRPGQLQINATYALEFLLTEFFGSTETAIFETAVRELLGSTLGVALPIDAA